MVGLPDQPVGRRVPERGHVHVDLGPPDRDVGPARLLGQLTAGGLVEVLARLDPAAGRAPVPAPRRRVVVEEEQHPPGRIDRDHSSRQPHRVLRLVHAPIIRVSKRGTLSRVLERVRVTSYLTPLREGGSLPAIVEADNLGTYVLKFRGAGQGPLALVAEIIGGELARCLGLRTPELALAELDEKIPPSEPDPEIQDLLRASVGLNLAVDFLPGSAGFDPLGWTADEDFASELLWFDALIQNVDRSWRNPNLLVWHGDIWLIDHGAALYFHHDWSRADPAKPYDARQHVLRGRATRIEQAHRKLAPLITMRAVEAVTADVPPGWFGQRGADAYVEQLVKRAPLVPEVIRL
jgi:hypothetical protein